jgi:hypothetical protein
MSIVASRAQRRALAITNRKLPTSMVEVPIEQWPNWPASTWAPRKVWRSRDYLVQEFGGYTEVVVCRLSVCCAELGGDGRWIDGISWEELQRVKNECGYEKHDAVEVFPRDGDVVNVANMRHLWVLREPLDFAWRSK